MKHNHKSVKQIEKNKNTIVPLGQGNQYFLLYLNAPHRF